MSVKSKVEKIKKNREKRQIKNEDKEVIRKKKEQSAEFTKQIKRVIYLFETQFFSLRSSEDTVAEFIVNGGRGKLGWKEFIKCNIDMVRNKKRSIVEGIGLVDLYTEFGFRKELQSYPMIIIGRSVLSSSVKAFQRNYKMWLHQTNINIKMGERRLNDLRKHRTSVPGAVVKEY